MHKQLELVQNDMCCMNEPSLASVSHILTFIDDISRFTWVYFLKNKNFIFEMFKDLGNLMKSKVINLLTVRDLTIVDGM